MRGEVVLWWLQTREGGREEDVKLLLSSRNVNANEAGPTGFGLTTQEEEAPKFWIGAMRWPSRSTPTPSSTSSIFLPLFSSKLSSS